MKNLYYAAILTLYDENCQIDEKAQRRYVQFLLDKGVRGFFPCGTSGEYTTLSREENLRLLQIVLEENKGRVPVIPCASTASLHNTVELIQEMEKLGIQEVSICPPYYTPLRQEDILDYYLHILQEVKVKVYLYNIPAFTNPLYMETFERLLEEPRIIGIKDSSGSMKTISRYVATKSGKREDFKVMTGTDEMILPALCGGCFGSVSALSGIIPEVHNLLYDTYRSRLLTAQELQIKLAQLATECEKYVFPVGYKFALEARGFAMPSFRQNVAEHLEGENYGQTREQIHRLVKEILALAEEKKGKKYQQYNTETGVEQSMRITNVEAIILKQPGEILMIGDGSQDTVLIKIETDEGITGWGECDSSPYVVKAIVDCPPSHVVCRGLKDILIGQDPFDVEKIWNDMYRGSYYYGRRSVGIHAMSGIDIALWDIMGKATGMPVHKLLGGKVNSRLRAYASMLMPDTEEAVQKKAKEYVEKGFTAIKFGWGALGESREKDIRLVRAAREAMGEEVSLMLDIGYLWKNSKYAEMMCKELEQFHPYWIEEPMISDDVQGFSKLTQKTSLNIAGGEELTGLYEFKELIERGGVDIVQPDMSRCGGLTIAKKIADMALLNGVEICPHAFKSGILMAASIQLLATYRGTPILEYCSQETVLSKGLLKSHFALCPDGTVEVPDAPGLGIEIDEKAVERYRIS